MVAPSIRLRKEATRRDMWGRLQYYFRNSKTFLRFFTRLFLWDLLFVFEGISSACDARVAQGIEQQFPKLLVGGSIPLPGTILLMSC